MHAFDPDRDVLELCVNGNESAAVHLLIRRHGQMVYRYCLSQPGDTALAEDVYQQIFIAAYRDLWTFAHRSTVRTWLFAIAVIVYGML